jgi:hypothetical protein
MCHAVICSGDDQSDCVAFVRSAVKVGVARWTHLVLDCVHTKAIPFTHTTQHDKDSAPLDQASIDPLE